MSNLIHSEVREGFTIKFFAEDEHITLDQLGFDEADILDTKSKLDGGELVMFCAKVTASLMGIELACEYLGACIYADEKDFVNDNDYYSDMVATVIEGARATLNDLNGALENV